MLVRRMLTHTWKPLSFLESFPSVEFFKFFSFHKGEEGDRPQTLRNPGEGKEQLHFEGEGRLGIPRVSLSRKSKFEKKSMITVEK